MYISNEQILEHLGEWWCKRMGTNYVRKIFFQENPITYLQKVCADMVKDYNEKHSDPNLSDYENKSVKDFLKHIASNQLSFAYAVSIAYSDITGKKRWVGACPACGYLCVIVEKKEFSDHSWLISCNCMTGKLQFSVTDYALERCHISEKDYFVHANYTTTRDFWNGRLESVIQDDIGESMEDIDYDYNQLFKDYPVAIEAYQELMSKTDYQGSLG